ncbi:homoserine dehydrogenase [Georgenia deserti]|uniref:Homoserine dehydrogenase n=1 Tax=Georgenia deserti TaxID=2093781 RepID=A0ABW4LA53_9MICO
MTSPSEPSVRDAAVPVRLAVTGAAGGFARTLLPHARRHRDLVTAVLCDRDVAGLRAVCRQAGYAEGDLAECGSPADARRAVERGQIALTASIDTLAEVPHDVTVEATGHAATGYAVATAAIDAGRDVVMVTKETQAVAGRRLGALARDRGVRCVAAEGDQPANLVDLVAWAQQCGLDVVAAGKSSEYDVVHDPTTGRARLSDAEFDAASLSDHWRIGDDVGGTLARRAAVLAPFVRASAADVCEMTVAANLLGLRPDVPTLHHPPARVPELADVYAASEHGGIRRADGVVDVFTQLRTPDEASFAGGVFVIVRVHDRATAEVLAGKGHVISRDRRYACLYRPHHLMGLETVRSLRRLAGTSTETAAEPAAGPVTMYGVTTARLDAGTSLRVAGHHHEIDGVEPRLATDAPSDAIPFYLLDGARIRTTLEPGTTVRSEHVRLPETSLAADCAPGRDRESSLREGASV